jgi:adenylate kinase
MAKRLTLVVLGKQGAGKGTQCSRLAQTYRLAHVSTGDMLRAAVKARTELGLRVEAILAAGDLVPDEVVIALVAERLQQADAREGALLDGFPRTLGQAEALERQLGDEGVSLALNLDVPSALVMERLSTRRVCQECGTVYSLLRDDPEALSGTCSKCGGDVIQRADDQPAAIETRLATYERDTAPLLDFYAARDLLTTVDGAQLPDTVSAAIDEALRARGLA